MKSSKKRKVLIISFLISLSLLLTFLFPKAHKAYINHRFSHYLDTLFVADVSGNPLALHYTLANPEKAGVTSYTPRLTPFHPEEVSTRPIVYENQKLVLESFPYEKLTPKHQLTWDIFHLLCETELSCKKQPFLEEPLSPTLGIQAQLPILFAEYSFRKEQDIQDYLHIFSSIDSFFDGILYFENLKSQRGFFMKDSTADRIIAQCSSLVEQKEPHYLQAIFEKKIEKFPHLSSQKKSAYIKIHKKILQDQFLPAYQRLITGLQRLKGTGKNQGGLCGFPGGKEFYEYLVKRTCGMYESISQLQLRFAKQLEKDLATYQQLLLRHPEYAPQTQKNSSPKEMLQKLQQSMRRDFPASPKTSFCIKYVPKVLEAYASPAFYLTPPIDTLSPNAIYINPRAKLKGDALFTTLAHEGFPGHLYQTIFFASTHPPKIRHLWNMSGYVEGWATYIEPYAYQYTALEPDYAQLEWLNRSIHLSILSLLDTKIHYDNWTQKQASSFLENFGILDKNVQEEIYQVILEDPANYLKYYGGYLHFLDLRDELQKQEGTDFSLSDFHKKILEIGPCQFPVLEKYMLSEKSI